MKNVQKTWVIAGTDTDVGKTIVSAMLTLALKANYWKPIQTGNVLDSDRRTVQTLTQLPDDHFFSEMYSFAEPLSPNQAAEIAQATINAQKLLNIPSSTRPLIIECAGGLLVPITQKILQIDVMQKWGHPIVLCSRTTLGTINHTLLSIEALKRREIPIAGILFVGDSNLKSETNIVHFGQVPYLGRLPHLATLDSASLSSAWRDGQIKTECFE